MCYRSKCPLPVCPTLSKYLTAFLSFLNFSVSQTRLLVLFSSQASLSLFHPKIMYKTHPTMPPHNAATMVFKSEDEEDEDDKALVVVFAFLLGEDKARLAPIGI